MRFADIQLLRYKLEGFESLSLKQKQYIYWLSEAAISGRDITFDQFCKYNLPIRRILENVYLGYSGPRNDQNFLAFETYLKRVWFSNGIHHHYGMQKFQPGFTKEWLREQVEAAQNAENILRPTLLLPEYERAIFDPDFMPKRVNKAEGEDLVKTSACNFYDNITQQSVQHWYDTYRMDALLFPDREPISFGLNSTLSKDEFGKFREETWRVGGKYSRQIQRIITCLEKAQEFAENDRQKEIIRLLIEYYTTGDLQTFNEYCKLWVTEKDGSIDFINGFIEVYGDPLGYKGTWEALVEYVDHDATRRTQIIADNAQWFEDHSPVDPRFKKKKVKGVSARVICAAMLGGDCYPATPIGINLPNAEWIREQYGSKSITISNIIHAYNEAGRSSGLKEEFTEDLPTLELVSRYADDCDTLHTDLHECLGHGSGQMLPEVSQDALKNYGSTIEEARADLFGLYYCADQKMVELGLLPNLQAHQAMYHTYMLNGLMVQLCRINLGDNIEEDHMRNRALISRWALRQAEILAAENHQQPCVELYRKDEKTYLRINDYNQLRNLFAQLLAEIQRIKSEGDYEAAKLLVETYGVTIDPELHKEVLSRYQKLNIAPYKGFINPRLTLITDQDGEVTDVAVDYTETYTEQMLRYGNTANY